MRISEINSNDFAHVQKLANCFCQDPEIGSIPEMIEAIYTGALEEVFNSMVYDGREYDVQIDTNYICSSLYVNGVEIKDMDDLRVLVRETERSRTIEKVQKVITMAAETPIFSRPETDEGNGD